MAEFIGDNVGCNELGGKRLNAVKAFYRDVRACVRIGWKTGIIYNASQ